jgi:hypothetical protein
VRGAAVPVDTCHLQHTHPRVLLFRTLGFPCIQARARTHTHTSVFPLLFFHLSLMDILVSAGWETYQWSRSLYVTDHARTRLSK